MEKPFVEQRCHVGGCHCPAWDEAWISLRQVALTHPLCAAREAAAVGDDEKIEATDDLADELAQGQHGPPPVIMVDTSLCRYPEECRWAAPETDT